MKILIVEDEELLADSIGELLREKGFETDIALDGETGMEYAELGVYDLLILDVLMPKLNGYEVARRVRALHVNTPILMLTAKSALEDRVWGYDSNAVENHVEAYIGFLRKKLASIGSDVRIEAIRRLGYHLEAETE